MITYRYKWHTLFILAAVFLSYLFSSIWLFTGYYDPRPDSLWVDHIYQLKESYAASINGPKIIVIAGSSGLYGISAAQLESHFLFPAVNMATHGDLRDYYLQRAKKSLQPGDLVILAPEYTQYFYNHPMSETKADYIINFDKPLFRNLPAVEKIEILKTYLNPMKMIQNSIHRKMAVFHPKKIPEINRNGDHINNIGRKISSVSPIRLPAHFNPDRYVMVKIVEFITWCQNNNIKVLVTWPGTLPFESKKTKNHFIESLIKYYRKLGIDLIGNPEDFFVSEDLLFNTVYHLNSEGVFFRTKKLIELLEKNEAFNCWRRELTEANSMTIRIPASGEGKADQI